MVQAEVRLCAAGVPGAADRRRRLAHRRSGSDRGASGPDLRYLPAHRAARRRWPSRRSPSSISTKRAWPNSVSGRGRGPGSPTSSTNLTRLGAAAIAFDVMFAEPDRLNPDVAADTFRNLDEETRARLRALPSNDQVFADAMQRSRVVLGETGLPQIRSELDKTLPVTGLAMLGEDPQQFMFKFPGLLRNTEVLEKAAGGRGLLTIDPERDGIVRRVPMIMQAQGTTMPSLSFEMLRVVTGTDTILIKSDQGRHQEHRGQGIPDSDRSQWPALGSFFAARSLDLCFGCRRARRQRRAGQDQGQAGAGRNLGGGAQRHQDHAGRSGDARRRNPRPGAGERADPCGAGAAVLRPGARILCRADARAAGDRVRAEVRAGHAGGGRRAVCGAC